MPITYHVTINDTGTENCFRVTWKNPETGKEYSFEQAAEITPQETQELWECPRHQLPIGQKLFRLLDGYENYFQDLLHQAHRQAELIHIHLQPNRETADWPFELLAHDDKFLLPQQLHLDRRVSDWGTEKDMPPKDRPLKLLFMACSAIDVKPVLDYEREEEAVYQITKNLTIDMEVEDSGSLKGLQRHLEREEYDIVHLAGHAGIDEKGRPFFVMETNTGHRHHVYPDELWRDALIENPPRLLFLSGCQTGQTPDNPENTAAVSFSRLLVENYNVPAVLGWGRPVSDTQAAYAAKMLFHELSRGKTIIDAVQRARYELITNFSGSSIQAWPLLRLFSSGIPLNAMVEKNQRLTPKLRVRKYVNLGNSRVKVLVEGFVGRRRQIQHGLLTLEQDDYKVGIMALGSGGLGKSCLAGKICERFPGHTLIIVQGKLDAPALENALDYAFVAAQDEKGREILARKTAMTDRLTDLCATSFKEKNYLLLLDDFDRNLTGAGEGRPGPVLSEARNLLKVLLRYLPISGKMTQMIITGRHEFPLPEQNRDLLDERLDKVWLTGFREAEQRKKVKGLEHILKYEDQPMEEELLAAGCGNPLLLERLDQVVGEMVGEEEPRLLAAVKNKKEEFIRENLILEVLRQGGERLAQFLSRLSIYRLPVEVDGVARAAEKAGLEQWQELLKQGMALSLIEFDRARRSYRVTPLLREEFSLSEQELQAGHEAAVEYYKKVCANREPLDPALAEELDYYLASGPTRVGGRLGTS